jgi:formylglycine-generating enzyme required for sulfatase activity
MKRILVFLILTLLLVSCASAGKRDFLDKATGMEFVFVRGGCFQMGNLFDGGYADQKPVHEVCVGDFSIGRYEVTQSQWEAVMGNNPSHFSKGGNYPVEGVSWNDVRAFIEKLNDRTGKSYRLPTEAEWEYAARSGGKAEKWAGTSDEPDLGSYAEYEKNSGGGTCPVGKKKPNGLGLYDMSGNVWEWCGDWYGEKYYAESPRDNPTGPAFRTYRVIRGGSWDDIPRGIRAAARNRGGLNDRDSTLGCRLVLPE